MTTQSLLIDGQHRPSSDGSLMDVINPATEEVIATVPSATEADVDAAVAGARAALNGPWARLSARDRGRILWKLGDLLMARVDEIARLETLHNGKPIFESRQIEVPAAAECFQYYAGWADKVHGETIPVKGNYLAYTLREPVGVVAAIVPWNFPLLLTAWKVAPALACGNTVVLKPASQTPLTALALGDLALEAGVPPGVLNVITGRPRHRAASGGGQDCVHRRYGDRPRDHAGRRRDAEAAHARTGGQVAKYRVPRCGHRGRGTGSVDGDLLRQGGGLCGGLAPAGGSVDP
jgi:acyl-CoA reductase-like NAD-dependent aldehyde dehydrogenase